MTITKQPAGTEAAPGAGTADAVMAEAVTAGGVAGGAGLRSTAAHAQAILDELRRHGGKATASRRAVVEVLLANVEAHVTAEMILAQVRSRYPEVAESTIYRTLALLEARGVVEQTHLVNGRSTYHLASCAHQHLQCEVCEEIFEVPDGEFADLARRIDAGYGFEIHPHDIAIRGICRGCRRRSREAS